MRRWALFPIGMAVAAARCGGSPDSDPGGVLQVKEGPTAVVAVTDLQQTPIEGARE